jgi:hypothetical protein
MLVRPFLSLVLLVRFSLFTRIALERCSCRWLERWVANWKATLLNVLWKIFYVVDAPSRGPGELGIGAANLKTKPGDEMESRFRFFETDLEVAMNFSSLIMLDLGALLYFCGSLCVEKDRRGEVVGRRNKNI